MIKIDKKGFTLIEIIVATSIFTVVMLITIGALLSLNDSSRKAQALRTVIDNLNFAVEDMNRKVRTGDNYHCYNNPQDVPTDVGSAGSGDCTGDGGAALSLKTQEMECPPNVSDPCADDIKQSVWVAYIFRSDPVTHTGGIYEVRSPAGGGARLDITNESAITSPEVDIRQMQFRVVGSTDRSHKQPIVLLNISGVVNLAEEKLRTDFSLQTAIARRGIE